MLELFTQYSVSQVIVFTIGFVMAVKGVLTSLDYFKAKYKEKFNKDYSEIKDKEDQDGTIKKYYEDCMRQREETLKYCNIFSSQLNDIEESINDLSYRVDRLTESDKHDIKQAIVKDYHFFVETQHWIDDFSLESLELRYKDYQEEGGNSYISNLMDEIRKLPKRPPL